MIENGNKFSILPPQHEDNAFDFLQMYLCINQLKKSLIIKNVFSNKQSLIFTTKYLRIIRFSYSF